MSEQTGHKIDRPIVGWAIEKPDGVVESGGENMPQVTETPDDASRPFEWKVMPRPRGLNGTTYKLNAHGAYDTAIYVTINNVETKHGVRPFEIFIASRQMESFQWISIATRLMSAVMRQQCAAPNWSPFIIEECLETFDPGKQYFSRHYTGQYMNSVVQEIGFILREHCEGLGLIEARKRVLKKPVPDDDGVPTKEAQGYSVDDVAAAAEATEVFSEDELELAAGPQPPIPEKTFYEQCPDCKSTNIQRLDGCPTCIECGWSKCA